MMPAIWAAVGYKPLKWAWEHLHSRQERFITLAVGRRAGKTMALRGEILRETTLPPVVFAGARHSRLIYVVAPTAELYDRVWGPVKADFVNDNSPLRSMVAAGGYNKERERITLTNGTIIQAKTADNPKTLAGEPVTLAICDEAHAMSNEAQKELRPALSDMRGREISAGIPQSVNWFRSYWMLGQRGEDGEGARHYSYSAPSTANPYFPVEEMEDAREDMTDTQFRQLYLAEWAGLDGTVFRDVDPAFAPVPDMRTRGPYVMGLDIAKLHDWTVAYVIDVPTMQFVARDRFHRLEYPMLVERVSGLYGQWNCQTVCMDTTGGGEVVHDYLRKAGLNVSPYDFTNDTKSELVTTLAGEIEHNRAHFMPDDETLKDELKVFEAKISPSGLTIQYGAPDSFYDDTVVAAGLAVWKAKKRRTMTPRGMNMGSYVNFKGKNKGNW